MSDYGYREKILEFLKDKDYLDGEEIYEGLEPEYRKRLDAFWNALYDLETDGEVQLSYGSYRLRDKSKPHRTINQAYEAVKQYERSFNMKSKKFLELWINDYLRDDIPAFQDWYDALGDVGNLDELKKLEQARKQMERFRNTDLDAILGEPTPTPPQERS